MTRGTSLLLVAFGLTIMALGANTGSVDPIVSLRKDNVGPKYYGIKFADPYRSLEDNWKSQEFIQIMNKRSDEYFNKCPQRGSIRKSLNSIKRSVIPGLTGVDKNDDGKYYQYKEVRAEGDTYIIWRYEKLGDEPETIFSPEDYREEGTYKTVNNFISANGKYLSFLFSNGNNTSENQFGVKDVETDELIEDQTLRNVESIEFWAHNDQGFFYVRNDPSTGRQIMFHKLGTPQSEDLVKFDLSDYPDHSIDFDYSDDRKQLHIELEDSDGSIRFWAEIEDVNETPLKMKKFIEWPNSFYIGSDNYVGKEIYSVTNYEAQNYRVVKIDLENPAIKNWVEIIPEREDMVLFTADVFKSNGESYILLSYKFSIEPDMIVDHDRKLEIRKLNGEFVKELEAPKGVGRLFHNDVPRGTNELLFTYMSRQYPLTIYRYKTDNLDANDFEKFPIFKIDNYNPDDYVPEVLAIPFGDDRDVIVHMLHRKDFQLNGQNPLLFLNYREIKTRFEGWEVPLLRDFNAVIAYAEIHVNEPHSENSIIATAKYLIGKKYTSSSKLVALERDNCDFSTAVVKHPELFGGLVVEDGLFDYIYDIEFNTEGDEVLPADIKSAQLYSPYHNIKEVDFPAILLQTNNQQSVSPVHSRKFIAEVQYKHRNQKDTPFLLSHGKPKSDHLLDQLSFVCNIFNKN